MDIDQNMCAVLCEDSVILILNVKRILNSYLKIDAKRNDRRSKKSFRLADYKMVIQYCRSWFYNGTELCIIQIEKQWLENANGNGRSKV